MSQSAAVSFLPTVKEVLGGISWAKKHPIIATAACAGAMLSFFSYLQEDEQETFSRTVSFSDEHGHSLVQVMGESSASLSSATSMESRQSITKEKRNNVNDLEFMEDAECNWGYFTNNSPGTPPAFGAPADEAYGTRPEEFAEAVISG